MAAVAAAGWELEPHGQKLFGLIWFLWLFWLRSFRACEAECAARHGGEGN